jgi:hypothetical protein
LSRIVVRARFDISRHKHAAHAGLVEWLATLNAAFRYLAPDSYIYRSLNRCCTRRSRKNFANRPEDG